MNKRSGDPVAWSCLDDEQREIIREWYEHIKELDRADEADRARKENVRAGAQLFGLIPFAVYCAYEGFFYEGWLSFLLALPICYVMCTFIHMVFDSIFYQVNYKGRCEESPISWIAIVLQCIAAVGVSYLALSALTSML